jgi:hypothetical protein
LRVPARGTGPSPTLVSSQLGAARGTKPIVATPYGGGIVMDDERSSEDSESPWGR